MKRYNIILDIGDSFAEIGRFNGRYETMTIFLELEISRLSLLEMVCKGYDYPTKTKPTKFVMNMNLFLEKPF